MGYKIICIVASRILKFHSLSCNCVCVCVCVCVEVEVGYVISILTILLYG